MAILFLQQAVGDKAVSAIAEKYNTAYEAGNTVDLMCEYRA
jgi:hypothetical protein